MRIRNILPIAALAAKSLFLPDLAVAQNVNNPFSPKAQISFIDENSNLSSSLDLSLEEGNQFASLNFNLDNDKIKHNFGANFLMNKDPVWNVINGGLKYGFKWEPVPFIRQELKTFTGYQNISNVKYSFLYNVGQFFSGGEEDLTFILGNKDEARLEATGTLGGYASILPDGLTWDNYKAGYKISGIIPISFLNFGAWFNQDYTQFNKDKYFFVDSSNNINFGATIGLNLEEIALDAFIKKEFIFGKELDREKIYAGANAFAKKEGVGLRSNVELNQTNPELWKFFLAGGKTVFDDKGYLEVFLGLDKIRPYFGIGLKFSPGISDERIVIKTNPKKISPLIEEQGYKKPSEDFNEAIKETNTLAKIGNIGVYFPYKSGIDTLKGFFANNGGNCLGSALYRTEAARQNGYDNSWTVGYGLQGRNGHAFFLVEDKDGRVYATDDDSGVWLRVNVDSNASKEEMAKAAIEQTSKYMALPLPEGQNYYYILFDEKANVLSSAEGSGFSSKDKGYAPIDNGLMSRIGENQFY